MGAQHFLDITRRRLLTAGCGALALTALRAPASAADEPREHPVGGEPPPWLIAMPQFITNDPKAQDIAHDLRQIIGGDLRSSGRFAPIDSSGYIESIVTIDVAPRFADWRAISAQVLLTGRVHLRSDDLVAVEALLWDVAGEQQLMNERYVAASADEQRVAHLISREIADRVRGG